MSGASASIATSDALRAATADSNQQNDEWHARGQTARKRMIAPAPSAALAIADQGLEGGRFSRLAISCSRLS